MPSGMAPLLAWLAIAGVLAGGGPQVKPVGQAAQRQLPARRLQAVTQVAGPVRKCPLGGIVFNMSVSDIPAGWVTHYDAPYSQPTTLNDVKPRKGACMMWGAQVAGSSEISVAAFGDREFIESVYPSGMNNGVFWYISNGVSAGFAPDESIRLSPGDDGLYDCVKRVSWLLNGFGGYRAGCERNLDTSDTWHKVVMYGPQVVECDASVCGPTPGWVLKDVGLPPYCAAQTCTFAECCGAAKTCSSAVCNVGYLPKVVGKPQFCASTFCTQSECCVAAPTCVAQDCPYGYILKDVRSPYGCIGYQCTLADCCQVAPRCPIDVCSTNERLVLKSVDPLPFCLTSACSQKECCADAVVCKRSDCPVGYDPEPAKRGDWCAGPVCTIAECCLLLVPQIGVTGLQFQDLDLDYGQLGGTVSWVLPPANTTTTEFYDIFVGNTTRTAVPVGLVPASASFFVVPPQTPYAMYIYVYGRNAAGRSVPDVVAVSDASVLATNVTFVDLDVDRGEVGGTITWVEPWRGEVGLDNEVCRFNKGLRMEVGTIGWPGPAFFVGQLRLPVHLLPPAVVTVAGFRANLTLAVLRNFGDIFGLNKSEAGNLQSFLDNLPLGSRLMVSIYGTTTVLPTALVASFAAMGMAQVEDIGPDDVYAWIGHKGRTLREVRARAQLGIPLVVELLCPLLAFDVTLAPRNTSMGLIPVGASVNGAYGVNVAADTQLRDLAVVLVGARSALTSQGQPASIPLRDNVAMVSNLQLTSKPGGDFRYLDGNVVSWQGPDPSLVRAYRVYVATGPGKANRTQVGSDVPADAYELAIPAGKTLLYDKYSQILVSVVSPLSEQTRPASMELRRWSADNFPVRVTVLVTVIAVQVARFILALEVAVVTPSGIKTQQDPEVEESTEEMRAAVRRMRTGSFSEASEEPPSIAGRFAGAPRRGPPAPVLGKYYRLDDSETITAVEVALPCSTVPIFRELLGPLFPSHAHNRQPVVSVRELGTRAKRRLDRLRACDGVWDNDEVVLRKLSNRRIAVHGLRDKPLLLQRRLPGILSCFHAEILTFHLRIYAPLLALVAISVVVLMMKELMIGIILMTLTVVSVFIICIASPIRAVREVQLAIANMPPARIREGFWQFVRFCVGVMPCVPAFMTETPLGLATGIIVIVAAVSSAWGAHRTAAAIEIVVCGGMAAVALALRTQSPPPDTPGDDGSAAGYMAVYMSAALMSVRSIDDLLGFCVALLDDTPTTNSPLVPRAEASAAALGLTVPYALSLEAFAAGRLDYHMRRRFLCAARQAAEKVAGEARGVLQLVVDELHDTASRWSHFPKQLAVALGDAIDAASMDWGLRDLADIWGQDIASPPPATLTNVVDAIRLVVGPNLEAFELSLDRLLTGPLAPKLIAQGQTLADNLKASAAKLYPILAAAERCIGVGAVSAERARAEIFNAHAEVLTSTAVNVRDEVARGGLTVADIRMLHVQLERLNEQAGRVMSTLPAASSAEHLLVAREGTGRAREALIDALHVLKAAGPIPSLKAMEDVLALVENVLVEVKALRTYGLRDPVVATLPPPPSPQRTGLRHAASMVMDVKVPGRMGGVPGEPAMDLDTEVKMKMVGPALDKDTAKKIAEALLLGRAAVGAALSLQGELKAVAERTRVSFQLMSDAASEGTALHRMMSMARAKGRKISLVELQRLQADAIEFTTGAPARALVRFQDLNSEPLRTAFSSSLEELRKALSRLGTGQPSPSRRSVEGLALAIAASPSMRRAMSQGNPGAQLTFQRAKSEALNFTRQKTGGFMTGGFMTDAASTISTIKSKSREMQSPPPSPANNVVKALTMPAGDKSAADEAARGNRDPRRARTGAVEDIRAKR